MQSKPLQSDGVSHISGEGTLPEQKLSFKQRVFRIGPPPRPTSLPAASSKGAVIAPLGVGQIASVMYVSRLCCRLVIGVSTLCPPRLPSATAVISPMTVSHSPGRLCLSW